MKNILITGLPGIGKTTLIQKVIKKLKNINISGFISSEIRIQGVRKGFELISLDGKKGLLAHSDIRSSYRVGKYGVSVREFESFISSLNLFDPHSSVVIIDEIGRMECFSEKFKTLVKEIFNSKKVVIATIALKGNAFIKEIKERNDTILFELTEANRDNLSKDILHSVWMLLGEE